MSLRKSSGYGAPPIEWVVFAAPGDLRKGGGNSRFLLDEEYLGTFHVPGFILWRSGNKKDFGITKGIGVTIMDLFRCRKSKIQLLKDIGVFSGQTMKHFKYRGDDCVTGVLKEIPEGWQRDYSGNAMKHEPDTSKHGI